MLAKSKLNSIETLVSQALIDTEIGHEEFVKEMIRLRLKTKIKWKTVKNYWAFYTIKKIIVCMYKKSSDAKRLTKERKITAQR